jgi:hypothetical protein
MLFWRRDGHGAGNVLDEAHDSSLGVLTTDGHGWTQIPYRMRLEFRKEQETGE